MLRDNALMFVHKQCREIVGGRCYAMIQPQAQGNDQYPAIIYYQVGTTYSKVFGGLGERTRRIRIEVRSKTYEELESLVEKVVTAIKERLVDIYNSIDGFDDEVKVYRRILSVGIDPNG